jgi:hypothetical protein
MKVESKTMFKFLAALGVPVMLLACHPAMADDVCAIVALRDVASIDSPTTMMPRGGHRDSITQYQVDRGTAVASFCQHGGYCWPETVTIDGHKETATKLTNCTVDRAHPSTDSDMVSYELVPDRQKIGQTVMRESDVADQLMRQGLCHACAQNDAAFYVRKPASQCGVLAKAALEGNPDALAVLNGEKPGPECQFWH